MGIGVTINIDGQIHEYSESFPENDSNSNNVAEYSALSYILYYIEKQEINDADVKIIGDSQLVINQMAGRWKIKTGMYAELARSCKEKIHELSLKYPKVNFNFEWVRREFNSDADRLSKV